METLNASKFIDIEKNINKYIITLNLSHHPDILEDIFQLYNLQEYLKYFNEKDTTIQFNSYHNRVHSYSVALNCYEGAIYSKLDPQQIRILLLAGLFHDFNHSQGWYDDKQNVEIAVKGFTDIHAIVPCDKQIYHEDFLKVKAAIRATKIPYNDMVVKDIIFKLIRDADNMMPYELSSVRLNSYIGLLSEVNNLKDVFISDFCEDILKYTTKIKWNTRWAKQKYLVLDFPKMVRDVLFELKEKFKIKY
jgi:hypothetical protein